MFKKGIFIAEHYWWYHHGLFTFKKTKNITNEKITFIMLDQFCDASFCAKLQPSRSKS